MESCATGATRQDHVNLVATSRTPLPGGTSTDGSDRLLALERHGRACLITRRLPSRNPQNRESPDAPRRDPDQTRTGLP